MSQNSDPDQIRKAFYGCAGSVNWSGYCNPEIDELIERKLATDDARPIIFYRNGRTCRQPYVKGLSLMANSPFNGWRMERPLARQSATSA